MDVDTNGGYYLEDDEGKLWGGFTTPIFAVKWMIATGKSGRIKHDKVKHAGTLTIEITVRPPEVQ